MTADVAAPWPTGAGFDHKGLSLSGVLAEDLADRFGTPLVVVDEDHFRARCRAFAAAFPRALWAVKAFPLQALARIAADEGLGLLAATEGEVELCLRAGVTAERVMLHGSNKLDGEIRAAVDAGIGLISLDGEEDAIRVAEAARDAGRAQPALLRLAPGVEVEAHAYVTTGAPDTKFGVPVAEGMAMRALERALAAEPIDVRGLHVHVGSQLLGDDVYLRALEAALDFLAEARRETGWQAEILDLGGGMGATYRGEVAPDPSALAAAVLGALREGCGARGLAVPELVVEPGRAVAGNAAITLYRVGTVKEVPGIRRFVSVDGGMSDNIRPALYGSVYTMALASRRSEAPRAAFTVVGRHCETGDTLATDLDLPSDVIRGDLLAVAATGAYEYAMASTYNKVGRPAVVVVGAGREPAVAARREDLADLFRLEAPTDPVDDAPVPEGVEVRPARPSDAKQSLEMIRAVAAEARFIRTETFPGGIRAARRRYREGWTSEKAHLVAIAGGRVIGELSTAREDGQALRHVASLGMAIVREWRGRGVGSALMTEAIRWAREVGVEKLTLSVYPHNTGAIALYRKFGFSEEGRLHGHSKKSYGYDDEVVMARWL